MDDNPGKRCNLIKESGEYCEGHADFPNLGRQLKDYAEKCRSRGEAFHQAAFLKECYPHKDEPPEGNLNALVGTLLCLGMEDL